MIDLLAAGVIAFSQAHLPRLGLPIRRPTYLPTRQSTGRSAGPVRRRQLLARCDLLPPANSAPDNTVVQP